VFGIRLDKSSQLKKVLVIGNGESRCGIDLTQLKKQYVTFGCNAVHRDAVVDYLICYDKRTADEAFSNPSTQNTIIYRRDSLPPLPDNEQSSTWGSGSYAVFLAAYLGYTDISLLGFDLYPINDQINNIYKGSKNYESSKPVDPSYWVDNLSKIFQWYPTVEFTIINNKDWNFPKEWKYSNVKLLTLNTFQVQ
jgi:hypothetical protein